MSKAGVEATDEGLGADELILQYRRVRAKIESMTTKHEEAVKPYKDVLGMLKDELKRILDEAGADSCKTEYGTAYKSVKTNVKTVDKHALVGAVLEPIGLVLTTTSFDHLVSLVVEHLDVKANKTVAEDYLKDNGESLPGTEVSRFIDINVRK